MITLDQDLALIQSAFETGGNEAALRVVTTIIDRRRKQEDKALLRLSKSVTDRHGLEKVHAHIIKQLKLNE